MTALMSFAADEEGSEDITVNAERVERSAEIDIAGWPGETTAAILMTFIEKGEEPQRNEASVDVDVNEWDGEPTHVDGETIINVRAREKGVRLYQILRAGLEDGSIQHSCAQEGFVGECVACAALATVHDIEDIKV